MRVQDYMTADVFSIQADRKLAIAEDIMSWARVRHVPVVDRKNHVVGLVTHRDLLRASLNTTLGIEQREHLTKILVRDVMNEDVVTIDPEATIQAAARLMHRGRYGCLPVVNSRNELLGIITEVDLLGILLEIDLDAAIPKSS